MKQIDILYDNVNFSNFDKLTIQKIVNNALDRYVGVIKSIEVRLKDINGPKGGIDKLVTLRVLERSNKEHVIKSKGMNFMQATHSACNRAKSTLGRHLDKLRSLKTKRKLHIKNNSLGESNGEF